jgi:ADP-ribosylglycohydrolase
MAPPAPNRLARIEGGLLGLLIGDALGAPYEFHAPSEIPALAEIEYAPPAGYARAHAGTPPGTWSDDGATALALLASLLTRGRLDSDDLGVRLLDWREQGVYAVDGRVFDIGVQTSRALDAIARGVPALNAGSTEERALGNGSLMRVLPLALWSKDSDTRLVADTMAQSRVTHGHPRAQICCALYCLWARGVLDGVASPWASAVSVLRGMWPESSPERAELEYHIRPDDPPEGKGQGYVVDTLRSARWSVETTQSYEEAVRAAIALGHDTDTTACVAGGIAGMRYGVDAIPARWRDGLRGQDILVPLRAALLAWRQDG